LLVIKQIVEKSCDSDKGDGMVNNQTRSLELRKADAVGVFLLILIFVAVLVRISNSVRYDLNFQHDPNVHLAGIYSLMSGQIPVNYAPPIYQAWYLAHKVFIPSYWSAPMTPDQQMKVFVGLGNLSFFLVLLSGIFFLGKILGLSKRQTLLWLALVGAMVPLHRSLNMMRPENFQLALSPWVFLTGINWFREIEKRGVFFVNFQFVVFQILCILEVFQKVGGAAVVITAYFSLLIFTKIKEKNFQSVMISTFITVLLFVATVAGWYKITGNFILEDVAAKDPNYDHSAPLSFFVSFPMTKFLVTPYRDELKTSMAAILLSDFYGDYWRYGYNHYKFTLPPVEDPKMLFRQQLGGIVSLVSFIFLVTVSIFAAKKAITSKFEKREILSVLILGWFPLLFGLIYLGLSSQVQFHPGKANIVKWEYILFTIPFLILPIVHFSSQLKDKWSGMVYYSYCFFLILFGFVQSLYLL